MDDWVHSNSIQQPPNTGATVNSVPSAEYFARLLPRQPLDLAVQQHQEYFSQFWLLVILSSDHISKLIRPSTPRLP